MTCDLVADVDDVSREHCRIVPSGGGYVLVDTGSTNGTFVDDRRLDRGVAPPPRRGEPSFVAPVTRAPGARLRAESASARATRRVLSAGRGPRHRNGCGICGLAGELAIFNLAAGHRYLGELKRRIRDGLARFPGKDPR